MMQKNIFVFVILFSSLVHYSCVNAGSGKRMVQRGEEYYKKGQFDLAIAAFSEAIAENPKNTDAYMGRGNTYVGKEKYDEAISDFTKVAQLKPKYIYAYINRSLAYFRKRQFDEAIADSSKAIAIDPKSGEGYIMLGTIYTFKKEYEKAWNYLCEAGLKGLQGVSPQVYDIVIGNLGYENLKKRHLEKGYSLAVEGRLGEAKQEFMKFLLVEPSNNGVQANLKAITDAESGKVKKEALAYFLKARILYSDNKRPESLVEFGKAIASSGNYAIFYIYRGNAYDDMGNPERALRDYDKAIQIDPKYYQTYLERGVAYAGKEKYDQALSDYSKALELNPRCASAYWYRGTIYESKGKIENALADYAKAVEINPNLSGPYWKRGGVYFAKKEFDKAIYNYTKAIALGASDHDSFKNRGESYLQTGAYDAAIADLTKAIGIYTDYDTYEKRGHAYLKKGLYNQAISDLSISLDLIKEFDMRPEPYIYRGQAYHLLKQYDAAIADFTKAIEKWPGAGHLAVKAYGGRGAAYGQKGDLDRAIADFTKAIQSDITQESAALYYEMRAVTYYEKKQYGKAWEDVRKARELGYQGDPNFIRKLQSKSGRTQ